MESEQISNQQLHILLEFIKNGLSELDYSAVHKAILSSPSHQNRLFKAFTHKKDYFVEVGSRRKSKKITLRFSALPNALLSTVSESLNLVKSLANQNSEPSPLTEKIDSETLPPNAEQKRKGRGKAKKQSPPRSLVNVLIDDSDIELLNELAAKKDLSVSQLVRSAVRHYLLNFSHL